MRGGGEHEFARQQQGGPYFRRFEPGHAAHPRPAVAGGPGMMSDRRVMTLPAQHAQSHARRTSAYSHERRPSAQQNDGHGSSGSPPHGTARSASLAGEGASPAITTGTTALTSATHPASGYSGHRDPREMMDRGSAGGGLQQGMDTLYDLIQQADALKYSLQDLHRGYEAAQQAQAAAFHDFRATAAQASTLLGTLQQSADSLREMVRYEVQRAERKDIEELQERVKALEKLVAEKPKAVEGGVDAAGPGASTTEEA